MPRREIFENVTSHLHPCQVLSMRSPSCCGQPSRTRGVDRYTDLAGHSVWAQLPESQGGLDASQQGNYVQVLDTAPKGSWGGINRLAIFFYLFIKGLPAGHSLLPPTSQGIPVKNWRTVGEGRGWDSGKLGISVDWVMEYIGKRF